MEDERALCDFAEAVEAYGDEDLVDQAARIILAELPGAIAAMEVALAAERRSDLANYAHRLAASAGNMHALYLWRELRVIELLAEQGTDEQLAEAIAPTMALLRRFQDELADRVGGP